VDTNCTSIEYTFEVTNLGSLNLENIVVTDNDIPGLVINGPTGDDDMNGQLNGTETWRYTATYILQQNDLNNGQVQKQAQVEANVVGNPAQTVTDQSHPD
ncbi:DUF7507 domain-containing protein, partial [Flagellimonas flava]|uniref:DUF7507 domain-containing protein n=1 Tax=Flagellimonas flava TaxID=570519 RepID=UPI003D65C108